MNTSIVVIGGGYAGVLAANRLQAHPGVAVTLVNPRAEFVERIRLHQLVAGNDDAVAGYDELLHPSVELVVDTAERIDADTTRVLLASGSALHYDYLVYAVGSAAAKPTVPGADVFAYTLAEYEDARRLRSRLQTLTEMDPIVVVGAGLTGIETAAELAEAGHPVTLIGAALAPSLGGGARADVRSRLLKLGVRVIEEATVAAVGPHAVQLAVGDDVPAAMTVWTAGFTVPQLAADSGLACDELGRLLTDETLTSCDSDRIVGAGDAVAPSAAPLRMSCQAAMPLAAQAAATVLARLDGTVPADLDQAFTGQCVSLGRRAGVVQLSHPDDSPRRVSVGGRPGAAIKELVCKGTLWFLRREARKPGSYMWLKGDHEVRANRELASAGAL
ncbi:NAD(P)/FAD-dependent oxidoreductase [Mycolicibacterium brumae]|nr:FAD-dependent oxidoreductase [Mycolicibacterium brumae]RWA20599.1 hypothetical protein MBRU_02770 [Mycolicibacterium brumae DSM 44177]UWW07697.1 FAD-dependent oxidoreductase [Mycolicibacterium brumae]